MKASLLLYALLLFSLLVVDAQKKPDPFVLKLYEDNDLMNIRGHGTDEGYTHGFRADVLYSGKNRPSLFVDRWLTKYKSDVITHGWGVMQTMITPANLEITTEAPGDYRYACSMTVIRTFHVSNPLKKYSIQSEFVLGVLGPAASGKATQESMHHLMQCDMPMGWHTQYRTALLANVNITFEKALMNLHKSTEWIGGVKTFSGTSMNALSFYTLVRVGKMNPYFNGLLSNYRAGGSKWQLYGIVRPSIDFIIQNAHVQGGMFRDDATTINEDEAPTRKRSERTLNHSGISFEYGVVVTRTNFSISFTERNLYGMINEQGRHVVGNISMYIPL